MKKRTDFVTNSSSSSFIISKDNISKFKLQTILLEIANKEGALYDCEDFYSLDDVKDDGVGSRYRIKEGTEENPVYDYDDLKDIEVPYTNHYIVDNGSNGRYDWDVVEEVMKKYNVPWEYGYCD